VQELEASFDSIFETVALMTCLTECGSAEDDRLPQTSLSVVQFGNFKLWEF
jgi:hypothetical protein